MTTLTLIDEKEVYPWYHRDMPKRRLRRKDKALIIEEYFANEISIRELCFRHNLSYATVCSIISLYFKKGSYTITIQSVV